MVCGLFGVEVRKLSVRGLTATNTQRRMERVALNLFSRKESSSLPESPPPTRGSQRGHCRVAPSSVAPAPSHQRQAAAAEQCSALAVLCTSGGVMASGL